MPPILDVAIGIVFVFLLFSLVVSALNEVILSYLDKRAQFLKEGIAELFGDSGPAADRVGKIFITADRFFQHGLITVLSRGKYRATHSSSAATAKASATTGVPSYVPGKSFVLALISLITKGEDPKSLRDLRPTIEALGNHELKETLLSLYDDSRGNLDHFKANIENWFNESMDRVGGWYKRYAQQWLLSLALGLAIVCNVDSVRIIRALSLDKTLRESMVRQAEDYARSAPAPANPGAVAPKEASLPSEGGNVPATAVATAPSPASDPAEKIQKFKAALGDFGGTGVPMGWTDGPSQQLLDSLPKPANWVSLDFWRIHLFTEKTSNAIVLWLSALVGWSVTALAASLGAPFWFDLLNRFVDIRGVGRAPEESDRTSAKKPASGVESYVVTGDSLASAHGTGASPAGQPGTGLTPQETAPTAPSHTARPTKHDGKAEPRPSTLHPHDSDD